MQRITVKLKVQLSVHDIFRIVCVCVRVQKAVCRQKTTGQHSDILKRSQATYEYIHMYVDLMLFCLSLPGLAALR